MAKLSGANTKEHCWHPNPNISQRFLEIVFYIVLRSHKFYVQLLLLQYYCNILASTSCCCLVLHLKIYFLPVFPFPERQIASPLCGHKVAIKPNMDVFGLGVENIVPGENKLVHGENMQTSHKRPQIRMHSCDLLDHCSTMLLQ